MKRQMKVGLVQRLPDGRIAIGLEPPTRNPIAGFVPKNDTEKAAMEWTEASLKANPFMAQMIHQGPQTVILVSEDEYRDLSSPGVGELIEIGLVTIV